MKTRKSTNLALSPVALALAVIILSTTTGLAQLGHPSKIKTEIASKKKMARTKTRIVPVTYYSVLSKTSDFALAISMASHADGAVAIEWTSRISHEQQFRLKQVDGEWFQLIARHSGKALVVKDTDQNPVVQGGADTKNHRTHWKVIPDSDGFVRFQNRERKRYLATSSHRGSHGSGVILAKKDDSDRQKWKLKVADIEFEKVASSGKLSLSALEITGKEHPENREELREFLHGTTWSIRYGSTSGDEEYKMTFDRKGTLTLDSGRVSTLHVLGPKTIKLWNYDMAVLSDGFDNFQSVDSDGKIYYGVLVPKITAF